jgi:hypothetical protein
MLIVFVCDFVILSTCGGERGWGSVSVLLCAPLDPHTQEEM